MAVIWLPNLALQSQWDGFITPIPITGPSSNLLTEVSSILTDESGNAIVLES